jgi:DNA modification methylase
MYKKSDYKDKSGMIFNMDCMNFMSQIKQGVFDLTLTDIPYDMVSRPDN